MMGSGIYSDEIEFDEFECSLCGEANEGDVVATDDWGRYEIDCRFCGHNHRTSSIKEDRYDYHDY